MRNLQFIIIIFSTLNLIGQNLEKGIYRGQKPLIICYLTYSDTTIEVEYFNQKGGQIFGHFPAKKLIQNIESFSTKPILKSIDDSILVYVKKNYFLIKRKGFSKMKVYKTTDNYSNIQIYRLRHTIFADRPNLNNMDSTILKPSSEALMEAARLDSLYLVVSNLNRDQNSNKETKHFFDLKNPKPLYRYYINGYYLGIHKHGDYINCVSPHAIRKHNLYPWKFEIVKEEITQ